MTTLCDLFPKGSPVPAYLKAVLAIHHDVLRDDLIALYLHGSVVQRDYHPGASDIDILGIVAGRLDPAVSKQLTARLEHDALPVPAFGLELILCALDDVSQPVSPMPFEYALSTGREWGTQVEARGETSDILVHMLLCQQSGFVLAGPKAGDVLGRIPTATLRSALLGEMLWHRNDLRKEPTDQAIVNAVLNAARSLYAAEAGQVISKTAGAEWWLSRHPDERTVSQALEFRKGRDNAAPVLRSAQNFVELAIASL